MEFTFYELQHARVTHDGSKHWLVRDAITEEEFGNSVLCELFTKKDNKTRKDMLDNGYIHLLNQDNIEYYCRDYTTDLVTLNSHA